MIVCHYTWRGEWFIGSFVVLYVSISAHSFEGYFPVCDIDYIIGYAPESVAELLQVMNFPRKKLSGKAYLFKRIMLVHTLGTDVDMEGEELHNVLERELSKENIESVLEKRLDPSEFSECGTSVMAEQGKLQYSQGNDILFCSALLVLTKSCSCHAGQAYSKRPVRPEYVEIFCHSVYEKGLVFAKMTALPWFRKGCKFLVCFAI